MAYDWKTSNEFILQTASKYRRSHVRAKGVNFMTSDRTIVFVCGKAHVELSFGKGLGDNTLYGVTVYDNAAIAQNTLSRCLHSRSDVLEYLEILQHVTTFKD
jgi:hypothetical protein